MRWPTGTPNGGVRFFFGWIAFVKGSLYVFEYCIWCLR